MPCIHPTLSVSGTAWLRPAMRGHASTNGDSANRGWIGRQSSHRQRHGSTLVIRSQGSPFWGVRQHHRSSLLVRACSHYDHDHDCYRPCAARCGGCSACSLSASSSWKVSACRHVPWPRTHPPASPAPHHHRHHRHQSCAGIRCARLWLRMGCTHAPACTAAGAPPLGFMGGLLEWLVLLLASVFVYSVQFMHLPYQVRSCASKQASASSLCTRSQQLYPCMHACTAVTASR